MHIAMNYQKLIGVAKSLKRLNNFKSDVNVKVNSCEHSVKENKNWTFSA